MPFHNYQPDILGQRSSRYRWDQAEPVGEFHSKNPQILAWWTPVHDGAIRECIADWQWHWPWHISDRIVAITSVGVLNHWKTTHSYSRNIWYNAIMYFARSRAEAKGLVNAIRQAETKVCPLCGLCFDEGGLSNVFAERFGVDGLDFCEPCLFERVTQNSGSESSTREEVIRYLQRMFDVLEKIPSQNFGEGKADFIPFSRDERIKVLVAMAGKPRVSRVKELFGSWLHALVTSGLLHGDVRPTSRGTQCLANDGHVCLSLAEKMIDDTLSDLGLAHEKEPHYGDSNYRADFAVNGVLVEYFGLFGNPEYDRKIEMKRALALEKGIRVLELYPKDLVSRRVLERRLLGLDCGNAEGPAASQSS